MRVVSVLLVLVVGVSLMPLAGAIGGGNPIWGPLRVSGCHGYLRAGTTCTYTVTSSDPTIIFFRWDFDDNGVWDFPNQVGGGSLGKWSTLTSVTWRLDHSGVYRVCVQGWDGTSTKVVGGVLLPDGPIACLPPGPPPGTIR